MQLWKAPALRVLESLFSEENRSMYAAYLYRGSVALQEKLIDSE